MKFLLFLLKFSFSDMSDNNYIESVRERKTLVISQFYFGETQYIILWIVNNTPA